jgi:SAM-dependent methyltransferase
MAVCRLDFGCGSGSSIVVLAERGARVVGAETEQVSLEVAAQRIRLNCADLCALVRIPYLTGSGSHLPFADGSFDVCTLIGVIEHMRPVERVACVAEIHRVVRPGGRVFIFDTPNRLFPKDLHTTLLWFVGWLPRGLARWYAVKRGRFDGNQDFQRYGANGVSRREIDRLFPARLWSASYEKPLGEVVQEYAQYLSTGLASRLWWASPSARCAWRTGSGGDPRPGPRVTRSN